MSAGLRLYRRDLALFSLERQPGPVAAGDLLEHMGVSAQGEGHPEFCWRSLTGPDLHGTLRALEGEGMVVRDGTVRDSRAGRTVPLWRIASHVRGATAMPVPPDDDDTEEEIALTGIPDQLVGATARYDDLSRPQLYALLEVADDMAGVQARVLRDIQEMTERARRRLAAVGLAGGDR